MAKAFSLENVLAFLAYVLSTVQSIRVVIYICMYSTVQHIWWILYEYAQVQYKSVINVVALNIYEKIYVTEKLLIIQE